MTAFFRFLWENPVCIVWLYLALINFAAFFVYGADKRRARRRARRIPEATLFLLALLGGTAGALAGMYIFRHKTKHKRFVFGLPAILAAQCALGWLLVR